MVLHEPERLPFHMQCYVQDASSSASSGLSSSKKPRPGTKKKQGCITVRDIEPRDRGFISRNDGCQLVMASGAPLGADPPRLVGREPRHGLRPTLAGIHRRQQATVTGGPVYPYIKSKENHCFL